MRNGLPSRPFSATGRTSNAKSPSGNSSRANTHVQGPRGTEGAAAMVGPEYEWVEGGFGNDILFRNNRFVGYEGRPRLYVGGGAAYGKRIPASAHDGVREVRAPDAHANR